jgi:hypothetical protein
MSENGLHESGQKDKKYLVWGKVLREIGTEKRLQK